MIDAFRYTRPMLLPLRARWVRGCFAAILLLTSSVSMAVTWCHDYSWYRASQWVKGTGRNANRLSPGSLKHNLTALGYTLLREMKPGMSDDGVGLKKGDVIVIGSASDGQTEDHSGFVVDDGGHIDHMIQKLSKTGIPYAPEEAEKEFDSDLKAPLVRRGWTVSELRNKPRVIEGVEKDSVYKSKTFQVWRRTRKETDEVWAWVAEPINPSSVKSRVDLGTPLCTNLTVDLKKGTIGYQHPDTGAVSKLYQIDIEFSPIPLAVLEGEPVQLTAALKGTPIGWAGGEGYADSVDVSVDGNGMRALPVRGAGATLVPQKYAITVTGKDGVKRTDVHSPSLIFELIWPEFVPQYKVGRTIKISGRYFEGLTYQFVRRKILMKEIEKIRLG